MNSKRCSSPRRNGHTAGLFSNGLEIVLYLIGGDEREIVFGMDNKSLQDVGRIIWATIENHQDQLLSG